MAYSKDYRQRAIEFKDAGHTYKELYEAFKIHPSTLEDWRTLLDKTGSLEPNYPKTRKGKIDPQKLAEALERKPEAYLSELATQFNCTKQAVFYACKKLDITLKKKHFYTRKDQN